MYLLYRQIRGPSGSSVTGIVPSNAYPCLPDPSNPTVPTYTVIGANGDTIYNRFMQVIDRTDLIGPDYQHNHHRVQRQKEIEDAISAWTSKRQSDEVIEVMNKAGIPVGRVVTVKEVVENVQVEARGAVRDVWVENKKAKGGEAWNVKMLGTVPVLEGVDSQPRWAGPEVGEHTDDVLMNDLGLNAEEVSKLREGNVVA